MGECLRHKRFCRALVKFTDGLRAAGATSSGFLFLDHILSVDNISINQYIQWRNLWFVRVHLEFTPKLATSNQQSSNVLQLFDGIANYRQQSCAAKQACWNMTKMCFAHFVFYIDKCLTRKHKYVPRCVTTCRCNSITCVLVLRAHFDPSFPLGFQLKSSIYNQCMEAFWIEASISVGGQARDSAWAWQPHFAANNGAAVSWQGAQLYVRIWLEWSYGLTLPRFHGMSFCSQSRSAIKTGT